jgi:hypothetical protein
MATAALLLGAALPALAAAPFGQFGGKVGGGNSGGGLLPLHGWALDDNGVASVDILVDGFYAGRASYGRSRTGVTRQFPGFPNSAAPGWAFQLDTTHYLNGQHRVVARITSTTGEIVDLPARRFNFSNASHQLNPWGRIEFPQENAELRGRCTINDPTRRYSVVEGQVFDVGTEDQNRHGVGWVELLLDGSILFNSKRDCFFSPITGGYSQCQGLVNKDPHWGRVFRHVKDADRATYRFVMDVGLLIAPLASGGLGYRPGSHLLTIRAGDRYDNISNVDSVLVFMSCDEDTANEASFGFIDHPVVGNQYAGTIQVTGWALDWEGVSSVTVLVDHVAQGTAALGLFSPSISSFFVGYPQSGAPGWRFFLDTTAFSDGEHFLQIRVTDVTGETTLAAERHFTVNNVDG